MTLSGSLGGRINPMHFSANALLMADIQAPLFASPEKSYTFLTPPDAALYDLDLACKSSQEYMDEVKHYIVSTKFTPQSFQSTRPHFFHIIHKQCVCNVYMPGTKLTKEVFFLLKWRESCPFPPMGGKNRSVFFVLLQRTYPLPLAKVLRSQRLNAPDLHIHE